MKVLLSMHLVQGLRRRTMIPMKTVVSCSLQYSNSLADSPSDRSYTSENFVHIKQETGDHSTPPPEAGAPTPRLYVGGLGYPYLILRKFY